MPWPLLPLAETAGGFPESLPSQAFSPAHLPAHPAASRLRSSLLFKLPEQPVILPEVRPDTSLPPLSQCLLAKERALGFGDCILLELIETFKPFYFLFFVNKCKIFD